MPVGCFIPREVVVQVLRDLFSQGPVGKRGYYVHFGFGCTVGGGCTRLVAWARWLLHTWT
jgi:hypothetical protein